MPTDTKPPTPPTPPPPPTPPAGITVTGKVLDYSGQPAAFLPVTVGMTASDPGGNTIKDNRNYSNSFGANLSGAWTGVVQAVGNTWNPSLQGTDAAGHYASQIVACAGGYQTLTLYNSYCSSGGSISTEPRESPREQRASWSVSRS